MFGSDDWREIDPTQVWDQKGRKSVSILTSSHLRSTLLWNVLGHL